MKHLSKSMQINMDNNNISLVRDKKLFQFYHLCKNKYLNLEGWILLNELEVNHSISTNSPKFPGYTALHFAVKCNNLEAVKVLLKHEADFTIKNAKGQTPLHLGMEMILYSQSSGQRKNLELILDEMLTGDRAKSSNPIDNTGLSHFHIACFRNNYFTILAFIRRGVDINNFIRFDSSYWPGYTGLHIAAKYSLFNSAKLLFEYGANINAKNAAGLTPLHFAIKKGNWVLTSLLFFALNQKCVNPVDSVGLSLLHGHSRINGKSMALCEFLQNKMNINIPVRSDSPLWAGCTPLHMAIRKDSVYKAMLLIQHGADINIKNANNVSPLQLAIHKNLIDPSLMSLIFLEHNKRASQPIKDSQLFELFSACMGGKLNSIENILNELNVNSTVPLNYPLDLPGYTPLHFAVERGDLEIIELLLKNGADLYTQDANGLSSLHLAIERKNYPAVKKILSFCNETAKNPSNNNGLTHLHIACMVDNVNIAKNFLDHGVSTNLVTKLGETPLHFAARFGSKETTKLLLIYNADVNAKNINGLTPFDEAIQSKEEEIAIILLLYDNEKKITCINKMQLPFHISTEDKVNFVKGSIKSDLPKNHAGFTSLHLAIKYNCPGIVEVLLSQGANIAAKDSLNKTPLHYVFKLNSSDSKRMLDLFWHVIEANNVTLIDEETDLLALHVACMRDDSFVVEKLLKHHSDVNNRVSLNCPIWPGFSPLHFAVKYGSLKTVELLLSNHVDVNATDKYGFTPLHLASACSKIEIVEKLLASGSDPATRTTKGITSLRLALQAKANTIVVVILSKSVSEASNPMDNKGLTYFHIACIKGMIRIVEGFIRRGVDIDEEVHPCAPKYPGYTPLHIAVERRNCILIDLLLEYGADVNKGFPLLHLTRSPDVATKLLKHGVDPNQRNGLGYTFVELAIKEDRLNLLELALKHGADPNLVDPLFDSSRPLKLAITLRRERMIDALLNGGVDVTMKLNEGITVVHETIRDVQLDEVSYVKLFTQLVHHGCDLDALDVSARRISALHLSYWPVNVPGLRALLRCGANIDAEDVSGRTVVSYLFEFATSRIPRSELYRLFRRNLEVRRAGGEGFQLTRTNEALYETVMEMVEEFLEPEEEFEDVDRLCKMELESMRDLRFGGSVSLYDMVRSVNKMAAHLARNGGLAGFVRSSKLDEMFPECACLVMMQYAMAVKRKDLLLPAVDVINKIMSRGFGLSCWELGLSEAIVAHLSDDDLKNLAAV